MREGTLTIFFPIQAPWYGRVRSIDILSHFAFGKMIWKTVMMIHRSAQVDFLKATGKSREMAHRRPLTAVLAGFGVGCLIGGITGLVVGKQTKAEIVESNDRE